MGEVYKAFDPSLDRTVALKTIVAGANNPALVERLVREARACGRLQHPGIVMVHDIGDADGLVFIAMEYLEGRNLADAISGGLVGVEQSFDILIQMLDALDYAHSEGVVHRDIKPSNVILLPNGRIKILDFGIARVAHADPLTMTGEVIGTPNYMSPEQMKAQPVDGRTDIYSTGVLGYELFTRRRAFDGETITAVMLKVIGESAPPMATPVVLACPQIEAVIQKAIAKTPNDRFAHARDMAEALRDVIAGHRDAILRAAAADGDKTVVIQPRPATGARADTTERVARSDAPIAPEVGPVAPGTPESTLRVTPAVPPSPVKPSSVDPLPSTIRQHGGSGEHATATKGRSKWFLVAAALLVVSAVIYFAPRFESTTGVDAQKSPGSAASTAAAPAPAPAPPSTPPPSPAPAQTTQTPQATVPVPAPPAASTSPAGTTGRTAAPAAQSNSQASVSAPPAGQASGALDAHAVSFAAGSDAALAAAVADALKAKGIDRKLSGARWELTVRNQISIRPSGLGSGSLTADYVGDLEIRDRSKDTRDARHFDGHALEFGEPVVRAAAVRALAEKMADELAQVIK
jgi:serine/threonine protein kinase